MEAPADSPAWEEGDHDLVVLGARQVPVDRGGGPRLGKGVPVVTVRLLRKKRSIPMIWLVGNMYKALALSVIAACSTGRL